MLLVPQNNLKNNNPIAKYNPGSDITPKLYDITAIIFVAYEIYK